MSQPPRPEPIGPAGFFDGLHARPILIGVVADLLASLVASSLLLSLFLPRDADVSEETLGSLAASPEFMLASLVVGLACTAFGGFVGARRAPGAHLRHGAWIGVGSALLGLLLYTAPGEGDARPLWFDLLGFALVVPAGALGGAWAGLRARRPAS